MRAELRKYGLRAAGSGALCAALLLCVAAPAQAQPPLALLQAAKKLQEPSRSPEEKRADRAARALTVEQREAARRVRLAQIALVEQLIQMKPERREQFLRENPRMQRLPDPQRRRLRQLTERLSRLPSDEQTLVLERYRLFLDLPPQKQQQARRIYQHWRTIEPGRRRELLQEIEQLRDASPQARRERLQSEDFSKSYSAPEQRIVRALSNLSP